MSVRQIENRRLCLMRVIDYALVSLPPSSAAVAAVSATILVPGTLLLLDADAERRTPLSYSRIRQQTFTRHTPPSALRCEREE